MANVRPKAGNGSFKKCNWFLIGLIGVSFFVTIFLQSMDNKRSGLQIFGTRSLLESPEDGLEFEGEPLQSLFLIVPYRNRSNNKMIFVNEMKRYLHKKNVTYRMLVVEQMPGSPFNRGLLMNAGFKEAVKVVLNDVKTRNETELGFWNPNNSISNVNNTSEALPVETIENLSKLPNELICFIFHDVDLIPIHEDIPYSCQTSPNHLSTGIRANNFSLPYFYNYGGVTGLSLKHFLMVNGFPNRYWGWGGEDDDLYDRIKVKRLKANQLDPKIGRYNNLAHRVHTKEESFKEAANEFKRAQFMMNSDGLRQLRYKLVNSTAHNNYIHILVDPLFIPPTTVATVATTTTTTTTVTTTTAPSNASMASPDVDQANYSQPLVSNDLNGLDSTTSSTLTPQSEQKIAISVSLSEQQQHREPPMIQQQQYQELLRRQQQQLVQHRQWLQQQQQQLQQQQQSQQQLNEKQLELNEQQVHQQSDQEVLSSAVMSKLSVEANLFKINQRIHLEMVRDISKHVRQMIALLIVLLVLVFVIFFICAIALVNYLKRGVGKKEKSETLINGIS